MTAATGLPIKAKERDTILQALRAGVVPRSGLPHIQVGRAEEVKALIRDLDRISEGGAAIRFVIGSYGSGKTFFLNLVRAMAMQKKLVSAAADLTPARRLQSTGGQARSLYAELMRNMATRSNPEGGALVSVVEKFVAGARAEAKDRSMTTEAVMQERMAALQDSVGGYDFAQVVTAYWNAYESGSEDRMTAAVRWLRGEFATKTEAKEALGVRTIVDDASFYDQLKLLSVFVRLAGYGGLLICLDEMVNISKLTHAQSRNANYEQILRIINDSLQGSAIGLGFVLGGTPEFLTDPRRGLSSYPALQSRLAENSFAGVGLVDYSSPVIRLPSLTPEDLFVLLRNLRSVQAGGDISRYLVPDEALNAFMAHCSKKLGDAYFRTPRKTIKAFLDLLAILEQNPGASWSDLLGGVDLSTEQNPDLAPLEDEATDDELATFKI